MIGQPTVELKVAPPRWKSSIFAEYTFNAFIIIVKTAQHRL